jgi:hypothetical protein
MKSKSLLAFVSFSLVFTILSCSPKDRVALVKYDITDSEMTNKNLGQNIRVAIVKIPDRRDPSEGGMKMIGTVYNGFKHVIKRIYSEQTVNLDVTDAFGHLFSANGFQVMKYPRVRDCNELSDERLCVKGVINRFWTESFNRLGAVVDIDAEIYDRKLHEVIWSGKIESFQKKGMGGAYFTNTDKMVLLLNDVFAEAMDNAWNKQGMRKALEGWNRKEKAN